VKPLKTIFNIGVPLGMSPEDAKYIGMCNLGAFFFILFNIPFMFYFYNQGWTFIIFEFFFLEACLAVTFILNRFHSSTFGLIWFGSVLNLHLVILSVVLGWDIVVHYLIFFTAGGAVMLFRRSMTGLMIASIIGCIFTYYMAYFLAGHIDPLYKIEPHQREFLNTVIEITFCILIVANGLIGRYGAVLAEDRLKEEKARSEDLYQQLQKLDRQKTTFFQNVSHELRTPLTLITGPLKRALTGQFGVIGQTLERQLRMILRNAGRLLKLINQLLDISKLDAGKMELSVKEGNLLGFTAATVDAFKPAAEASGVSINIDPDSERTRLSFDPEMIEKVISNLMSNALKFTPRGGRVDVRVFDSPDGAWGILSVKDTGHGIAEQEIHQIFDRFHQVDDTTTKTHPGTGIGLSLAKELVEMHGGEISVISEPDSGSEFVVSFPKESAFLKSYEFSAHTPPSSVEADKPAAFMKSQPPEHSRSAANNRPSVLVVEDNDDMRLYLREIIEPEYTVIEATDGVAALAAAKQHLPVLIVSDVMMPRMDGCQLCREINASGELSHIPVVLLTAKATDQMAIEGMSCGAYDYVTKPFSQEILRAKIDGIVKRQIDLQNMSRTDHLTGLRNRESWEQEVLRELGKIMRFGGSAAIAFVDLDDFKMVNDTYGHAVGDDVLRALAAVLNTGLRTTDLAGRFGGEEFVVYFPETTGSAVAETMQRLLSKFRNQAVGGHRLKCSFSAGVVTVDREQGHSLKKYVSLADAAMYKAKRRGKDRVEIGDKDSK